MSSKLLNLCMFLVTILSIILICLSLVSCSYDLSSNDFVSNSSDICDNSYVDIGKFTKIKSSFTSDFYVHNYTGVCYVYVYHGGFYPLYNSDGTLLIYSN